MPLSASERRVIPPTLIRSEVHERVLDAALACFGRWGPAKTTLEDVAKEAGLSRATVYRVIPGGKSELGSEVAHREIARAVAGIDTVLAEAESLDALLVAGVVGIARTISEHELVQYLLLHEPDVLLPFIAFDRLEPALDLAVQLTGPHLRRFLPAEVAVEVAEWMTRLILSFTFVPGSVDLTDEIAVETYLRSFVLPGIELAVHPCLEPSESIATTTTATTTTANYQSQGE